MTKIIITGDSHIGCMKKAVNAAAGPEFEDISFRPLGRGGKAKAEFHSLSSDGSTVIVEADMWGRTTFSNAPSSDEHSALVVVSFPLNTSRIHLDYSWDTHVPWHMKQTEEEAGLSDAAVSALIEQDSKHSIAFVAALKGLGLRLAVVEGPRFFENAPYLEKTRFDVAKQVEDLYRQQVREALSALDVAIIEQPAETIDKNGCTKPEFDHENPVDIHHANASYGALVLKRIIEAEGQQ